jgi:hypothetical protein
MIEIREYRDTDEAQIQELFLTCFGRKLSSIEWAWKYKMSPWGSVAYVALDDKKLISHYGAIRYAFYRNLLWTYQPCDVMTHPDYRGKIYGKKPPIVKTAEKFYIENTMDFAFGFPSERHARLQTSLLGGSQHRKVTLLKKHLLIKNEIKHKSYILKVGWDSINIGGLDDLWKSCSETYPLSIFKDSTYLLWRYMEHPSQYYTLVTLRDIIQKKIVAIAVIKCSEHEMNIFDFFVNGGCEVLSALWEMLESHAIKMKAHIVNVWINLEENISRYLVELGYENTEDVPFQARVINKSKISQNDFFTGYCYRMGDLL